MNPEIKQRWVDALRSGEYPQTKGALRRLAPEPGLEESRPVGFCCLGVLCDLAEKDGVITSRPYPSRSDMVGYGDIDETGILPKPVKEWAGIETAYGLEPGVGEYRGEYGLPALNDRGTSFTKLADLIEEYL